MTVIVCDDIRYHIAIQQDRQAQVTTEGMESNTGPKKILEWPLPNGSLRLIMNCVKGGIEEGQEEKEAPSTVQPSYVIVEGGRGTGNGTLQNGPITEKIMGSDGL